MSYSKYIALPVNESRAFDEMICIRHKMLQSYTNQHITITETTYPYLYILNRSPDVRYITLYGLNQEQVNNSFQHLCIQRLTYIVFDTCSMTTLPNSIDLCYEFSLLVCISCEQLATIPMFHKEQWNLSTTWFINCKNLQISTLDNSKILCQNSRIILQNYNHHQVHWHADSLTRLLQQLL